MNHSRLLVFIPASWRQSLQAFPHGFVIFQLEFLKDTVRPLPFLLPPHPLLDSRVYLWSHELTMCAPNCPRALVVKRAGVLRRLEKLWVMRLWKLKFKHWAEPSAAAPENKLYKSLFSISVLMHIHEQNNSRLEIMIHAASTILNIIIWEWQMDF